MFFFFKQKTAYEMRISDWSSDVCSSDLRLDMQKTMQAHAAVFRTQKLMDEGIEHLNKVIDSFEDVAVSDRSMIWNSDLVETLELDNLLGQCAGTDHQCATGAQAVA